MKDGAEIMVTLIVSVLLVISFACVFFVLFQRFVLR